MKKKLYLNTGVSILYQIVSVIIGLILPRLFLIAYGSKVNGLIQSITQMLGVISLIDLGVGAVVQAALYKPLADKDYDKISILYSSAKKYFNLIAKILIFYVVLLIFYYAVDKSDDFSWLFTSTLIISISISSFAQYYFGINNSILLYADQKIYITTIINLITLIINAILTILLIKLNVSIQIVKLVSSLIYILRPMYLALYVRKNYSITVIKNPPKNAIRNQWSGLAQHIASVLTNSADSIVLTFFSTFQSVSIYNIYVLPLNAIKMLIETVTTSYKSFFGNLIAKQENIKLQNEFRKYEIISHFIAVIIFGTILIVLVPFVMIYTKGINDANYDNQIFSMFITLAYAIYAIRIPYTTIIFSAGKFKETQLLSVIECVLNIVLSVVLVNVLGLSGVALATCIAVGYRAISSAYYLKKDILYRPFKIFIKHIFVDVICFFIIFFLKDYFEINRLDFFNWFLDSLGLFIIYVISCSIIYFLFYRNEFLSFLNKLKKGDSI